MNSNGASNKEDVKQLLLAINQLFAEQDWEQFHSPKNLAMNLMVEALKLAKYFTWLSEDQNFYVSDDLRNKLAEEVGDVFIRLLNFCDKFGIDFLQSTSHKVEKIRLIYLVELYKGKEGKFC